jgi:GDP-L-fucose synthase
MYPEHDRPHPESELFGTEPEPYLYAYAFTKKALVIGQRAYAQEFGMSCAAAVLPTVYGRGDSFGEDSHVMGALIGKFCRAKAQQQPEVEVWGDGHQRREFLYVDDAVDGILAVAEGATSPELNLATGESVSIREVAELIRCETEYHGAVRYEPQRFAGARHRVLSAARVRQELPWRPRVGLAEGVRRTVAAYRDTAGRAMAEPNAIGSR